MSQWLTENKKYSSQKDAEKPLVDDCFFSVTLWDLISNTNFSSKNSSIARDLNA